jgi:glycosyltransferase involved in cell wall biosynthesis
MKRWWWKIYSAYEKWALQKADHIFFISEEDKAKAIAEFSLKAFKCSMVTYGVKESNFVIRNKEDIKEALGLGEKKILYFNGTLDYEPNVEAVLVLLNQIDPLLQKEQLNYKIVISGNHITKALEEKISKHKNVTYVGFVPDVTIYYRAADLFLNPVVNNSGIKTKVVEALAHNCSVVSTTSGASGIKKDICGDKLIIVSDNNWHEFVNAIILQLQKESIATPTAFFKEYAWENIAEKAAEKINSLIQTNA